MTQTTMAITGAAGRIGTTVLPLLRRPGRRFVLIDSAPVDTPDGVDDVRQLDIRDVPALTDAFDGVSTVVHLAGIPHEATWADLLAANIDGTAAVLEAAQRARVQRVMLASSIHPG